MKHLNIDHRAVLKFKQALPAIMSGMSIAGVVATGYLSAKNTPEAIRRLEEAKSEKGEDLTVKEKIATAAPAYVPALTAGITTVALIAGSHILSKEQQAAILAAYKLVDGRYRDYQDAVKDIYGEETHERILAEIGAEKCETIYVSSSCMGWPVCLDFERESPDEKRIFFDTYSHRFFETTIEKLIQAEYHLNRNFTMRGYAMLNEFYNFLGLSEIDEGEIVGWTTANGDLFWIDFDHSKQEINGVECYMVSMPWEPSMEYLDDYADERDDEYGF